MWADDRVADWPMYTVATLHDTGLSENCHVQEMWTGGGCHTHHQITAVGEHGTEAFTSAQWGLTDVKRASVWIVRALALSAMMAWGN